MNQQENSIYQAMIREARYDYNRGGPGNWPGKPLRAPAVSLYPNILAELQARFLFPNVELLAEFADVSPEIMAAALEDNEELSVPEMRGLARYLCVNTDYLSAPVLSMIDPATNKGKARLRQLSDLMKRADGLKVDIAWKVERTRDAMERGKPVTYASWRWAVGELQDAIDKHQRVQHKPRSCRRATAKGGNVMDSMHLSDEIEVAV